MNTNKIKRTTVHEYTYDRRKRKSEKKQDQESGKKNNHNILKQEFEVIFTRFRTDQKRNRHQDRIPISEKENCHICTAPIKSAIPP